MKSITLIICLAAAIPVLRADSMPVGTWTRRPTPDGALATMIIEAAGAGRKLTFKLEIAGVGSSTLVVTTQGDGKDAPVLLEGKPSGQTMAIRIVDDRHTSNIIKVNGKPVANQKSELSEDGKSIKVESIAVAEGAQNTVEYWDRK